MRYKVETKLRVGNNTSISVSPAPKELKIGMTVVDEQSRQYQIAGVGMIRPTTGTILKDEVEILVKGFFSGEFIELVN